MHVLFLARRFYPDIGGVEKHVQRLSRELIAKGHTVSLITEMPKDRQSPREETVDGIHVFRIYPGKEDGLKKLRIWKQLRQLKPLLQSADVIHCHDVFFWYLPYRFIFPVKPVFTTFHGYESFPITQKAIRMRKLAERLSWGNICIGDFIPKWYGTNATTISYGAVDLGSKKQASRSKNGAVFIGRLDDQTGILTYVKAVALLQKTFPKFEMLVVGDGELKNKINRKVTVIGFQKDPEKYLSKYRFAFVSRYLSILEAFAAKRLVYAVYDNPVKEDYLKMAPYAPYIVIAKDAKELAEKAAYYLKHPEEEKKMVEKAYSWVKKQSWKQMADLYINLWQNKK